MSHFLLGDIFDTNSNSEEDVDMDNSSLNDINLSFNYENGDLMSSEFFDNVNLMEHENAQDGLFNLDNDFCFLSDNSSHADEVKSEKSTSSDSGKSSTCYDPDIFQNNLNNILLNDNILMSECKTVFEEESETFPVIKNSQIKIIGQNPATKRVIVTNPYSGTGNPKSKQILRVQPVSGNGKPLLLPFNVANFKTIKIVNPQELQDKNIKVSSSKDGISDKKRIISIQKFTDGSSEIDKLNNGRTCQYPPLVLSEEEKRLLIKEGIKLPTHYPLTKSEEKELKRIRRKIRNKISAQDSRKRKKEYVDGLEERVKRGSEENKFLLKRVKQLQKQNSRLMAQLSKLQALIFDNSSSKATPATCLMIVLFSALLVSLPNMKVSQDKELGDQQQIAARRALLFSHSATNEEDTLNMEEFLLFNKDEDGEAGEKFLKNYEEIEKVDFSKILDELNKNLENGENNCSDTGGGTGSHALFYEACKKYEKEIKAKVNNLKNAFNEFNNEKKEDKEMKNKHGFYEPDIDEEWPPSENVKIRKIDSVTDDLEYSAKRIKNDHNFSITDKNLRMSAIVGSQSKINASEI